MDYIYNIYIYDNTEIIIMTDQLDHKTATVV